MTPRSGGLQGRLSGLLLLPLLIMVVELSATNECGDGFYKTQRGVCCELCRAGMYKFQDCIADGQGAMCEPCPRGRFMERDNQEVMCTLCNVCGADKEVTVSCSLAQDTVCGCKEGLETDPNDSQRCIPESQLSVHQGYKTAVIVLGCTLAIALIIFVRRKWHIVRRRVNRFWTKMTRNTTETDPLLTEVVCDSQTVTLILQNKDNLKAWIGVEPSHLLEHLKNATMIPDEIYQAANNKHGEECVELVLSHFIQQGETECERLLNVLQSVSNHYQQLPNWIQEHGMAVQSVRNKENDLTAWIRKNPKHFLEKLTRQGRITTQLYTEAKRTWNVKLLLGDFIMRGNDGCLKLMFALQDVEDHYPEVKQWLSSLDFLKERSNIFLMRLNQYTDRALQNQVYHNKAELIGALGNDAEQLITTLDDRDIFKGILQTARETGTVVTSVRVLELVLSDDPSKARPFWELLWDLRDVYPRLEKICNGLHTTVES
ncbi:uncharacterized protein LOC144733010 [Lampetra planeri]